MAGAYDPLRDEFSSETEPASALPPSPADPLSQVEPWIVVSRADADVALDEFAAEWGEAANSDAIAEFVLVGPETAATISAPAGVAHDDGAAVAVTLPSPALPATSWVAAAPLATLLAGGFLLAAGFAGGWSAMTTWETSRTHRSSAVPSERVVASAPREAPTPQSATAEPGPTPLAQPPVVTPTKATPPPLAARDVPRPDVVAPRAVEAIPSGSLPSATQAPARTLTASPQRPIPPLSQVAAASAPPTTAPTGPRVIVPDTRAAAAVEPGPTPHLPASPAPVPLVVERTPATVSALPAAAASASPNAAPTPASEDSAIAAVLEQYRGAASTLDARAVAAVWPTTNTRALERAFAQLSSQELSFAGCVTTVNGTQATADCGGATTYVPRVGNKTPRVESHEWRFELRKIGQGWVIDRVSAR